MLRFFTILPKKLLKTSAFSFSVFAILPFSLKLILSLALDFSDSVKALLFSKKVCYQKLFFELSFHNKLF